MTIDERLERLAERHEAMAQSMELMQQIWEQRWTQIAAAIQQDAENIRALARIAAIHERRLSHLEGEPE